MKIAIGSDHAGFSMKEELRARLAAKGIDVVDVGTNSADSTDYPDYAAKVAHDVTSGKADRGVLVCFSGVGMSIAANKVHGVRAALGYNPDEVRFTRAHNDANIIAFGAHYTTTDQAEQMIDVFLSTPFDGGRHQRRVDKVTALENQAPQEDSK